MRFLGGLLLTVVLSPVALMGVACSSDPDPAPAAPDAGGSDAAPTGAQCASETTALTCIACCSPPDSYFASQDALDKCLCDGPCKAECEANACAATPTEATPACEACLTDIPKGQTCFPQAKAVCDADPACGAYTACLTAADCGSKP